MKKIILATAIFAALSVNSETATAQSLAGTPYKKEIHLYGENNFSSGGGTSIAGVGVNYKRHWHSILSYRIGASYSNLTDGNGVNYTAKGDSVMSRNVYRDYNVGSLNLGLEVERQFYKKVYLSAGFDARIGYGTGKADTVTSYYTQQSSGNNYYTGGMVTQGERNLGIGLFQSRAFIGARVYTGRMTFGLEAGPSLTATFRKNGGSSADADMTNINGRLYIGCRL